PRAGAAAGPPEPVRPCPIDPPAPGLALAGSRAQASSRGNTIRKAIFSLPGQGGPARACRGRALGPRGAGSLRKLASLSGEGQGVTKAAASRARAHAPCGVPLAQYGGLGGWPTTGVPFQTRLLPVEPGRMAVGGAGRRGAGG